MKGTAKKPEEIVDPRGFDEDLEAMIGTHDRYHFWTKDEEAKILRYYGRPGILAKDVAQKIGVTKAQLLRKATNMGITTATQQEKFRQE